MLHYNSISRRSSGDTYGYGRMIVTNCAAEAEMDNRLAARDFCNRPWGHVIPASDLRAVASGDTVLVST